MIESPLIGLRNKVVDILPVFKLNRAQRELIRQERLDAARSRLEVANTVFDSCMRAVLDASTEDVRQQAKVRWHDSSGEVLDSQDAYFSLQHPPRHQVLYQGIKSLLTYRA